MNVEQKKYLMKSQRQNTRMVTLKPVEGTVET